MTIKQLYIYLSKRLFNQILRSQEKELYIILIKTYYLEVYIVLGIIIIRTKLYLVEVCNYSYQSKLLLRLLIVIKRGQLEVGFR